VDVRIANAPTSWGVEDPADAANPPWDRLLDLVADAGYQGTELGPLGYLPQAEAELAAALEERSLELVAGYVFESLHTREGRERARETARHTCRLLAGAGARHLVIIQGFTPERERVAGRRTQAAPLGDDQWAALVATVRELAALASDHGLVPVFHPHAGTDVEFDDEIDRLASDTDVALCIDTGHCAYSGFDPVELYRRYARRVAYLHLKDVDEPRLSRALAAGRSFEQAVAEGVFCPLGEGVVDFRALGVALDEHAFDGWATVEQDRSPTDSAAAAEDAAASLTHLHEVGLA
jgi:inosose dehydratase